MEISLRRILGLYFLVTSLQYIPLAVFMLGVQNTMGPNWIMPAIYVAQGVVIGVAGLVLFRSRWQVLDVPGTITAPGIASILQLAGVYFVVNGLAGAVGPLSRLFFFDEVWAIAVSSELAAGVVEALAGGVLITRSRGMAKYLESYLAGQ
jgi:hypothetical protein